MYVVGMPHACFLGFTLLYRALAVGAALAGVFFMLLALGAYLSSKRLWRGIVLSHVQAPQQGYIAPQYAQSLLGQHGQAQTPLRPAGKVYIQGQSYQATTEGNYIAAQSAVVVTGIMGHTLVVQPSAPV